MSQSRQLAAIMFTDIVGYTALMVDDSSRLLKDAKEIAQFILGLSSSIQN